VIVVDSARRFAMVFLVISLRLFQPLLDQIDVSSGGANAGRRLLLERVKHVHRLLESNRVHRSIRVSVVGLNNLQHAGTEAFPGLRRWRCAAELRNAESVPHVVLDRRRKAQKVALGRPDPMQGLLVGGRYTTHVLIIPVLGYLIKRRRAQSSGSRDTGDEGASSLILGRPIVLRRHGPMEKTRMVADSRLEILPQFQVQAINRGPEIALITGTFNRVEGVAVDARGWLFVSESESSIADVVTLERELAGLDVPNWSMTEHGHGVQRCLGWIRVGRLATWRSCSTERRNGNE